MFLLYRKSECLLSVRHPVLWYLIFFKMVGSGLNSPQPSAIVLLLFLQHFSKITLIGCLPIFPKVVPKFLWHCEENLFKNNLCLHLCSFLSKFPQTLLKLQSQHFFLYSWGIYAYNFIIFHILKSKLPSISWKIFKYFIRNFAKFCL